MNDSDPLSLLLIDDDEEDYLIFKRVVSKMGDTPFRLEWVDTPEKAREIIAEKRHDLYLVDYRLGSMTGIEMLAGFDLFMMEQPFILLTGLRNKDIEGQATRVGISDYLVKGSFDEELLQRVLRYNIQRKKSEAERMQQLKEMNDAKDEFIALASHQLRTPATAVKQYLGILIEGYAGAMSDDQTKFLKTANESNDRQLMIINDLLKTAQLDAKRYRLKPKKRSLNTFIKEVIDGFDSILSSKKQSLSFEPGDDVDIRIDADEMKLALVNLIENAHKYSPDETTIHISTRSEGDEAILCVRDEGVGIAERDYNIIFEKFTRVQNKMSDETSGNGLGLYWVKRIVELHGGTLRVESKVGKGTSFEMRLPL